MIVGCEQKPTLVGVDQCWARVTRGLEDRDKKSIPIRKAASISCRRLSSCETVKVKNHHSRPRALATINWIVGWSETWVKQIREEVGSVRSYQRQSSFEIRTWRLRREIRSRPSWWVWIGCEMNFNFFTFSNSVSHFQFFQIVFHTFTFWRSPFEIQTSKPGNSERSAAAMRWAQPRIGR